MKPLASINATIPNVTAASAIALRRGSRSRLRSANHGIVHRNRIWTAKRTASVRRDRSEQHSTGIDANGASPATVTPSDRAAFDYDEAFSRNIGWVTASEQAALRGKRVAIAGLGGVGGIH